MTLTPQPSAKRQIPPKPSERLLGLLAFGYVDKAAYRASFELGDKLCLNLADRNSGQADPTIGLIGARDSILLRCLAQPAYPTGLAIRDYSVSLLLIVQGPRQVGLACAVSRLPSVDNGLLEILCVFRSG